MSKRPLEEEEREFLRQLGETIREVRREQGLLQEQLGARSGVTGSRVGEIERGIVDTSISRVWAIAEALGMSPAVLLRRKELLKHDARAVDEARVKLVAAIKKLPPQDLDLLTQLVLALTRQGTMPPDD